MDIDTIAAPSVVGLDLSLKATGIAHTDGTVETFHPDAGGATNLGLDRLWEIRRHVFGCVPQDVELVMIEGSAFAHDTNGWLAQLSGIVRIDLFGATRPFYAIPPSSLKRYATGHGGATKADMVDAAQVVLDYRGDSHDEADALWLRAMGWDLLGVPLVDLPDANREALLPWLGTTPVYRGIISKRKIP